MSTALLVILSIVGLTLAVLAIGGYFAIIMIERRSATGATNNARQTLDGSESQSASRSSMAPWSALDSDEDRQSEVLEPLVEAIEVHLEEALSSLPDAPYDLLVGQYGLESFGFALRRSGAGRQRGQAEETLLLVEARRKFNTALEGVLEGAQHKEELRDNQLRKALEVVRARRAVA